MPKSISSMFVLIRSACPVTRILTPGFDLSWNRVKGCGGPPNNKHLHRTPKDRRDCDLCLKIQWLREGCIHPRGVSAELKSILSLRPFVSSRRTRQYSTPDTQGSFMGLWGNSTGEVLAVGLFWSWYSFQPMNKSGEQGTPSYKKKQVTPNFCWQIREKGNFVFSPSCLDSLSTFYDC